MRDVASQPGTKNLPPEAEFEDVPYLTRVAGFRRGDVYGPDQVGKLFQEKGIAWSDGLGNGLYESLLICRKYGLGHILEAPIMGFDIPFLDSEWAQFREFYPQQVSQLISDLKIMEHIYGGALRGDVLKLVVLWGKNYPLAHFVNAYQRDPRGVLEELRSVTGLDVLPIEPKTPKERVALVRFWNWVRLKQSQVLEFEADTVREMLGPNTLIIANPHELPPLDFEGQGRAFEYPSVAVRPLLVNDDVMLRHYTAYFSQLFHDLTGKLPMVSVRMNLSAATPQFVPTGGLIKTWYDQAVRHGAGGFYFWTRDYPTDSDPETYDGPIPGNPVDSTLPQERWEASLDILGLLSTHMRFKQPPGEVAILVPLDSALLHRAEWRRIYATFSALAEERIFATFISDRQIENGGVPENIHLVLAPELSFISPKLRTGLEAFTSRGGGLVVTETEFYDRDDKTETLLKLTFEIETKLFDIFPLDRPALLEKLKHTAKHLRGIVDQHNVDPQSWVFDISCNNLPASTQTWLKAPNPEVNFAPWLYEHGSDWIMPYLQGE